VEELGDALAKALAMPVEERRQRHALLQDVVSKRDTAVWAADFLVQLERSAAQARSPFVASPAA
jgi:trehalose-6-phosphate synthase